MRNKLLEMSFAVSALVAVIGAAAVDSNPVIGMIMFLAGVAYCSIFAAQNGGI